MLRKERPCLPSSFPPLTPCKARGACCHGGEQAAAALAIWYRAPPEEESGKNLPIPNLPSLLRSHVKRFSFGIVVLSLNVSAAEYSCPPALPWAHGRRARAARSLPLRESKGKATRPLADGASSLLLLVFSWQQSAARRPCPLAKNFLFAFAEVALRRGPRSRNLGQFPGPPATQPVSRKVLGGREEGKRPASRRRGTLTLPQCTLKRKLHNGVTHQLKPDL